MSFDRKVMKVMSLILLAWALCVLVYDAMAVVSVADAGWSVPGVVLIVWFTFQGLFGFWVGMAGIKGANTPSKAGKFNMGALILALAELISLVYLFVTGADFGGRALGQDMLSLVFTGIALVVCIVGWVMGRRVLETQLNRA